ncbi:helix-turn-helix domain-containing protein [Paenibacillus larvae]|uniref:LexA family protein n=1 Tax=Paenibacillus larvae TaxID=1464 RepID=UPI00228049E2|nr:LexA family transcriptional regulator [Paenibacillus larvae]MCY9509387.1 helix-turn-helix domain-containing protein [Paenibacillus larvae]MCY9527334.1 helix-turn-helix domain-containing protein [Paenibacillus larvae]
MNTLSSMGKRIKYLRERKGYTQSQMAEKLDMNPANFSSYERDKSIPPSDRLARIADILNTSTDYLTCRTDEKEFYQIKVEDNQDASFIKENSIVCNGSNSPVMVPVIGTICPGNGVIANKSHEEYVAYPFLKKTRPDFAVKVKGDSMTGAGIDEADIVFFRKMPWAEYNGQIVAVIANGEEGSLKRMRWSEGSPYIELIPENNEYNIKRLLPHEITVCGVYAGHFKPDKAEEVYK